MADNIPLFASEATLHGLRTAEAQRKLDASLADPWNRAKEIPWKSETEKALIRAYPTNKVSVA